MKAHYYRYAGHFVPEGIEITSDHIKAAMDVHKEVCQRWRMCPYYLDYFRRDGQSLRELLHAINQSSDDIERFYRHQQVWLHG